MLWLHHIANCFIVPIWWYLQSTILSHHKISHSLQFKCLIVHCTLTLLRHFFITTGHHVVADNVIEAVVHAKSEASTSNVRLEYVVFVKIYWTRCALRQYTALELLLKFRNFYKNLQLYSLFICLSSRKLLKICMYINL